MAVTETLSTEAWTMEVAGGPDGARSDQRRQNLRRANHVRLVRAEFKRRLSAGSLSAIDVIADPPAELLGARVIDVLRAMPKVGPVKARTVLAGEGMSVAVRFGDLSPARRAALIATLETRGIAVSTRRRTSRSWRRRARSDDQPGGADGARERRAADGRLAVGA